MNKLTAILLGIVGVIVLVCLIVGAWWMGTYNSFVKENENVTTQWSQVETQYQRRFDLIPNLVNATQGYLKQEQKVFGDIAEARTHYASAATSGNANDQVAATNQMEGALSRLLVVMENYPQLQSNQTVSDLMTELSGTENRINVARERYNESVQTYNVDVKSFPDSIIANFGGFKEREFFKAAEGADKAPTVNLNN